MRSKMMEAGYRNTGENQCADTGKDCANKCCLTRQAHCACHAYVCEKARSDRLTTPDSVMFDLRIDIFTKKYESDETVYIDNVRMYCLDDLK